MTTLPGATIGNSCHNWTATTYNIAGGLAFESI